MTFLKKNKKQPKLRILLALKTPKSVRYKKKTKMREKNKIANNDMLGIQWQNKNDTKWNWNGRSDWRAKRHACILRERLIVQSPFIKMNAYTRWCLLPVLCVFVIDAAECGPHYCAHVHISIACIYRFDVLYIVYLNWYLQFAVRSTYSTEYLFLFFVCLYLFSLCIFFYYHRISKHFFLQLVPS